MIMTTPFLNRGSPIFLLPAYLSGSLFYDRLLCAVEEWVLVLSKFRDPAIAALLRYRKPLNAAEKLKLVVEVVGIIVGIFMLIFTPTRRYNRGFKSRSISITHGGLLLLRSEH